jgi:hypothetical protein
VEGTGVLTFHLKEQAMKALLLALFVWLSLVSGVAASLTPRKDPAAWSARRTRGQAAQRLSQALSQAALKTPRSEYQLTEQTEILLNDQPCRYADVPAEARIVHMEVAADKKTVLKVHFQTHR